jgi:Protein of unknown function (DUF4197)
MRFKNYLSIALLTGLLMAGGPAIAKVDQATAAKGTKEALNRAADAVVARLGKDGGFWNDKIVRIALPGPLKKANKVLKFTDKMGLTDGLHRSLNSAAEKAMPTAKPILKKAISDMSITDAIGIVAGGETAATDYFRKKTEADIDTAMRPIINKSLGDVKAYQQLNKVITSFKLPVKGLSQDDLTNYVTDKASDGMFHYFAEEEKAIRKNPVATGSKLLKTVFGKL